MVLEVHPWRGASKADKNLGTGWADLQAVRRCRVWGLGGLTLNLKPLNPRPWFRADSGS